MKTKKKNNPSISKVLREQNKSNDAFEILLSNISLEELIGLKLELSFKTLGFKLEGFPLWKTINTITKVALLKYAVYNSERRLDAFRILGITPMKFYTLLKKYKINAYFKEINDAD